MDDLKFVTKLTHEHDPDRQFDQDYWDTQSDEAKWAAVYEMQLLWAAQRGISEEEFQLDRTKAQLSHRDPVTGRRIPVKPRTFVR